MPKAATITPRKLQQLSAAVNHRRDARAAKELADWRAKYPGEARHAERRSFALRDALIAIDAGHVFGIDRA